jgi:serine protease Do
MKRSQLLFLFLLLYAGNTYSQQRSLLTENVLQRLSPLVSPASVRMWGYDTTTNQQTSAPFSGVVVTKAGYILTVAHTTTPGNTYSVNFPDGRTVIAQALGKINFPETPELPDVAMMKILTPGDYPVAAMGWSYDLQVNEPCFSIAYPETLNQPLPMMRAGRILNIKNNKGFIESTCMMEPGDSGGPLFDTDGRVIGLRSAIEVDEKKNYDVPIDLYRKYWTALTKPVHYTKYPEQVDSVPADPDKTYTGKEKQRNLRDQVMQPGYFDPYCVKIASMLQENSATINGVLFAVGDGAVVVSKSSAVGEQPVIFYRRKQVKATVLARDKENDLVLLQPATVLKGGLSIEPDKFIFSVGAPLLSPQPDSPGIRSIFGKEAFSLPKMSSVGFLGAAIAPDMQPLLLTFVMPGSPAAEKGAAPGDEIISINGVTLNKPEDYGRELYRYWPGDTLNIKWRRNASNLDDAGNTVEFMTEFTDTIVLGKRQLPKATHPAELFSGGKSERRDGFQQVIAHDGILRPEQCGGPVFSIYGFFAGINIARFSRTVTLAIPPSVVYGFINANLPRKK